MSMRFWLAPLSLVGLAAASAPSPPAFERAIAFDGAGRVAVPLDRDVYDGAREDLGDLRVVDERGHAVPFLIERGWAGDATARVRPTVRNRVFEKGRWLAVTLDYGGRVFKRDLTLGLSGEDFRRRVVVEASEDGAHWMTLVESAFVFAVPSQPLARYETIPLPPNDFPLLRVTIHHGTDDPERFDLRDAWSTSAPRTAAREAPLTPKLTRGVDPRRHETNLMLDLGAQNQPFQGLSIEIAEARFFRGAIVEGRRVPPSSALGEITQPPYWIGLGEGALYRYEVDGTLRENLRLSVCGRQRHLRIRVRDGDDAPLTVTKVTVWTPVERVLFEAEAAQRYRLTYGSADLRMPDYDLRRTITDPATWAAQATTARLLPPTRRVGASARVPWSEGHPALLWVGLILTILVLGAVTWRALRAVD